MNAGAILDLLSFDVGWDRSHKKLHKSMYPCS